MTEAGIRTLRARLGLEAESGADLDDPVLEWGTAYLPNDTRFRAQLRLRREFDDDDRWRFEIGLEGVRPPEETIDRWRDRIVAAAREVELAYEQDWLAPRPVPGEAPPLPAPPRPAPTPVSVLYRAYLTGRFTAATLDGFRDALEIGKRGRIDDDIEQFFGERVLRDEPGRAGPADCHRLLPAGTQCAACSAAARADPGRTAPATRVPPGRRDGPRGGTRHGQALRIPPCPSSATDETRR